jgi:murein endopeptidase
VDWDATWDLIHALIETDEVTYIFLTRSRQVRLREAAVRAGASDAYLAKHIQYPAREKAQTVRHSKGHTKHMHVRFKCAPDAERCKP